MAQDVEPVRDGRPDRSFPGVAKQMPRTAEANRKLWIRALGQLKQSLGDLT